ncbi:hypothetical protein CRH09_27030 [Nocardia terpenica]|uniref:Uncharacterized protein n=2 Tax=Nocardia terpenica TaxID=455432 RepID=A0A291RPN8_9NOCA|nr:hypothetical protein CRH09_27030 [Nocardia terpenica]
MNAVSHDRLGESMRLVGDVVREVISEVAPDELPLVDRLRQLGDARAAQLLGRRRRGRDLLGFGIEETLALTSPVVWVVLNEAAKRFTDNVVDNGGKAAWSRLRKLLGRAEPATVVPPMTREQIIEVRSRVMDSALSNGMSAERARIIADCVAGRLLIDPSGPDHLPDAPAEGVEPQQNPDDQRPN